MDNPCRAASLIVSTLLALAGCAGPAPRLGLSAQVAGGQLAYGAATLDVAKRNFFGGEDDPGNTGGGGGFLGADDPVSLHGLPPTVTQLTLSHENDLGDGTVLHSAVMAGYQHLRGTLPQGLGVLTDPLQIEIWAQSLSAEVVLGRSKVMGRGVTLDYGAGLGVSQVNAATHLQSALIDLRGKSRQTLPYAVAEARLSGSNGPALLGNLMVFGPGRAELRFGLMQPF